jgi:hypothetical protein
MAYHSTAPPVYIGYCSSKKDGSWGDWALGHIIEKACAACKKRGDSCLRVVVDNFGDIDLGVFVWCKTQSAGCSTALHRRRGGKGKAKADDDNEPKGGKRKLSEVEESEASEGEGPSKKVKSRSVIEDSDREDWLQDRED